MRTFQAHHPAGRRQRRLGVVNDNLIRVPGHFLDVFAQRFAGHRHAIGVQQTFIEERLHHHIGTARLVHVLGDILPTGL
jgi:N12 class adenine-specific DNA methylase